MGFVSMSNLSLWTWALIIKSWNHTRLWNQKTQLVWDVCQASKAKHFPNERWWSTCLWPVSLSLRKINWQRLEGNRDVLLLFPKKVTLYKRAKRDSIDLSICMFIYSYIFFFNICIKKITYILIILSIHYGCINIHMYHICKYQYTSCICISLCHARIINVW